MLRFKIQTAINCNPTWLFFTEFYADSQIIVVIVKSLLSNVNSCSRSLYAIARPYLSSVYRLSSLVYRLQRSCTLLRRLKFSAIFLRHLIRWPCVDIQIKFYGDRPRETSPSGELNTRGVTKYSNFGHIERSRKRCKIRAKLVCTGSRIWAFDWYQTRWPWMTLDDLERRNSPNRRVISPNAVAIGGGLRKSDWRYTDTFATEM